MRKASFLRGSCGPKWRSPSKPAAATPTPTASGSWSMKCRTGSRRPSARANRWGSGWDPRRPACTRKGWCSGIPRTAGARSGLFADQTQSGCAPCVPEWRPSRSLSMYSVVLAGFLASASGAGFNFFGVKGNGVIKEEAREVPAFTRISISHGMEANVSIGSSAAVKIRGDENLLKLVSLKVEDGELEVGTVDEQILRSTDTI